MRRRVTVVCICVSVGYMCKSHLTSGASVRPENMVTYSTGNGSQSICRVFFKTTQLQRSSTATLKAICTVGHFPAQARMRIIVNTT